MYSSAETILVHSVTYDLVFKNKNKLKCDQWTMTRGSKSEKGKSLVPVNVTIVQRKTYHKINPLITTPGNTVPHIDLFILFLYIKGWLAIPLF